MIEENDGFPNCCYYMFIFFVFFGLGMALITMYNYLILGIIVIIGGTFSPYHK